MSETVDNKIETFPDVLLPKPGSLTISSSPHIQSGCSIQIIMLRVIFCLLPAVLAAIFFFGLNAVRVILFCAVFSVGLEYLWCLICGQKQTWRDCSALVTGVILALNLSAATPWWICLIGSVIAIIIAKELFGGLGQNPFNPAAVARVALLIGFADYMTVWPVTRQMAAVSPDLITSATPLAQASAAQGSVEQIAALSSSDHLLGYFLGNIGGSIGETSALALLIGGIGLIAMRLIKWQIPLAVLVTVWVFTWLANLISPSLTPGPSFHLFTGGLMIGAFFMATDMVTSPMTQKGCLLFGAGIGILVCVIRIWGNYPEGVSFAIVIMNALVPLIDRICYKRPFGWNPTTGSAIQMRRGEVK